MKIALIDPSLFTWPYDIALARGLMEHGHEVKIYGRAPWTALPADETCYLDEHFYKSLEGRWARRLPAKLFLALKGLSHISSMARLIAVLKRDKPDIIHFQWSPLAIVDKRFLPALRRIAPIILTVHDSAPYNDNPKSRLQRVGATTIMQDFDRLIVETPERPCRIDSRLAAWPRPRGETIPAPVIATAWRPRESDEATMGGALPRSPPSASAFALPGLRRRKARSRTFPRLRTRC